MPETPETLTAALERASRFPETGLRLLDRHERPQWLPWSQVYDEARRIAGSLRALGLERGQRAALIYPTGSELFSAFFGILLAGAIPVPLYPPVRLGRLDEYQRRTAAMLAAAGVRVVLTEKRIARFLGSTIRASAPALGCSTLADLPSAPPCEAELTPADLALIQFSSGTTVEPKPVALSHRAILAQVRALNSFWPGEPDSEDSGVSWLPLYHDMGLIGCVFPALERPAVLTLLGPELFVARPALWLRAISRYRATISVAPNFAYGLCVEKIRDEEMTGVDLSSWRVALNGAEPVAPSVLRSFQERFAAWGFRAEAMTPVYGLSEATLAVTFSALDSPFRAERFDRELLAAEGRATPRADGVELVSVGRPVPGFEVRIVGDDGTDLPVGCRGKVWARGPSIMDGYFGRPEATAEVLRQGWLDTGDLGFLHDGELFLTGRAKDVIILRGRNYSPADLEQAVDAVAGARRGCAVAISHLPEGSESEVLWLFVEHARTASAEQIAELPRACKEAVLQRTGLSLDRVWIVEPGTLPRTSSGKLRRQEALRRHLEGALAPPERVTPFFVAKEWARSTLAYATASKAEEGDAG